MDILITPYSGSFTLQYDPDFVYSIPKEIAEVYNLAMEQWQQKVKFNSIRAKPFQLVKHNDNTLVKAGPFSYVQTRALQECLHKEEYKHLVGLEKEITSISLTVSVISDEGLLLAVLRSPKVSKYPSLWSVGLGEGLEDKDFIHGDLNEAVKRSLVEELGFFSENIIPDDCIQFIGTSFEASGGSFNILALANFTDQGTLYSSECILNKAASAEDSWEHTDMQFIPIDYQYYEQLIGQKLPGSIQYFNIIKNHLLMYKII